MVITANFITHFPLHPNKTQCEDTFISCFTISESNTVLFLLLMTNCVEDRKTILLQIYETAISMAQKKINTRYKI